MSKAAENRSRKLRENSLWLVAKARSRFLDKSFTWDSLSYCIYTNEYDFQEFERHCYPTFVRYQNDSVMVIAFKRNEAVPDPEKLEHALLFTIERPD